MTWSKNFKKEVIDMRILQAQCDQFAGIKNRSYTFSDGINVIVGDNEGGKSTLIELIYRVLFQNPKLNKTKDKEFMQRCFPANVVSGTKGDNVDGTVTIVADAGNYRLKKEWNSKTSSVKLIQPDDTSIADYDAIVAILSDILGYSNAVYSDIVFSRQYNQDAVVKQIFGSSEAKTDIFKNASETAVSGGFPIDELGSRLESILAEYIGNWDVNGDRPNSRNIRWKNGNGLIINKYYETEDLREAMDTAISAERSHEEYRVKSIEAAEIVKQLETYHSKLISSKGTIENLHNKKLLFETKQRDFGVWKRDIDLWPQREELLKKLRERQNSLTVIAFNNVNLANEAYQKALKDRGSLIVSDEDVRRANELDRAIERISAQMSINLKGKIELAPNVSASIKTALGEADIQSNNGTFTVSEAFNVEIPDVMRLEISPANIDVDALREDFQAKTGELRRMLEKYAVSDVGALQKLKNDSDDLDKALEKAGNNFIRLLGASDISTANKQFEILTEQASKLIAEGVSSGDERTVKAEIEKLTEGRTLEAAIERLAKELEDFLEKYGSLEELENKIANANAEISKLNEDIQNTTIPEELAGIADFEIELDNTETKLSAATEKLNNAKASESDAFRLLSGESVEELKLKYSESREALQMIKNAYKRYRHIYEVFLRLKESNKQNPLVDVGEKMRDYLEAISLGNVKVQEISANLEEVVISSTGTILNYDIVSEGTKETIALAFRLALLEHIFKDKSGFALFDDSLIEMDPARRAASATLLKKFAEKHQVIFTTCEPTFADLLGGTRIDID
jgi:energy-coupling factor transporter ATP-binding protein EcfA2